MRVPESTRELGPVGRVAFAAALLGLAGCSGLSQTENAASSDAAAASRVLEDLRYNRTQAWTTLRVSPRPWLGIERINRQAREQLPTELLSDGAVTLPLGDVRQDSVLAARIEAAAEIGVRLLGSGGARVRAFADALRDGWTPAGGIWTGPLDRLLDAWCESSGYEWRVADGEIVVVRRKTVTFAINALSGKQQYSVRTASEDSGGGEGSAGSSSQSIRTTSEFDPWPEIVEQIGRVSGDGAVVSVSQSAASVTVSARPAALRRVRSYLAYLNRTLLRPLTISAHVYSVKFDRGADYQIGIAGLVEKLFGARLSVEVGAGQIAIVRPRTSVESGGYAVRAAVRALQSVGTASRVLSADIPSLNGKPAQFFELLKTAYLRERSETNSETGTQISLTPGEISSGFSLSYTARITAPDEVLVRLVASLRDRPRLVPFGPAESQIQLPVYGDRGVQATQRLRRGEALVVSGFIDRSSSLDREGTFDPRVPVPEGARRASTSLTEQVLLLSVDIGEPLGISEVSETEL